MSRGIFVRSAFFVVLFSGMTLGWEARSAGFDNNEVGLRGVSMGTALHGIADDGSAVYYNPAGLVLIDEGVMNVEAYTYLIFTKFRYSTHMPVADSENESTEIPVIPGGFITQSFDRIGVGLGVNVPYGGGGVVYKDFSGTDTTLEASAGFFGISASAAVEVVRQYLAVGVTPTIYIGTMENKMSPDPMSDMRVVSKNSGYAGVGMSLGIMSAPLEEKLKLGLILRSPVHVEMDGTVDTTASVLPAPMESDSTMSFMLPMELTLGVGSSPIPALTLGLTGTVIFHGMMDELTSKTTSTSPVTGQKETITTVTKTHYKHNFRIALGAEYMIIKQFGVRAGIQFIQSPSKDKGLVPTSNDVSQLLPSLGLAVKPVHFLEIGIAGAYIMGFERTRKSDMSLPQQDGTVATVSLKETFDADHWMLIAGLRFDWDFIR